MITTVDLSDYREVTESLFPDSVRSDERIALMAFNVQFGVSGGGTVTCGDLKVFRHEPSGVLVDTAGGRINRAWALKSTPTSLIAKWRESMEAMLQRKDTVQGRYVLLCAGAINHRWELPATGLRISPVPESAPRAPVLMAQHPCILSMPIQRFVHHAITCTIASRQLDSWALLLNVTTYLNCTHTTRGRDAWAWDRFSSERSKWVELAYESPELHDDNALEQAASEAPLGTFVDDADYYLGLGASVDDAATLPFSLDETLIAANGLSPQVKENLRKACRWIRAADDCMATSESLAFVGLVSALETLTKHSYPDMKKPTPRFRQFLAQYVSYYSEIREAAKRFYDLRSRLVHDGFVFPSDWVGMQMDVNLTEASAFFHLTRVARLAITNWLRSKAGLKHVAL